jgi:P-type Ca2+ transporter type 2C
MAASSRERSPQGTANEPELPASFVAAGLVGLSSAEAAERLARDGPNELQADKPRTAWHVALDVVREPMLALLLGAAALYVLLGEARDAWTLLGFVLVVIVITIVQERRTERALGALRDLSSPRASVVRDGRRTRIPGREIVRGDLVFLSEGDRVPADGVVRRARSLSIDEAILTGESLPVGKRTASGTARLDPPGGEDLASVFSGTLVSGGDGLAEVVATGQNSELGRIGAALASTPTEPTRLQRETRRLVRWFAVLGISISLCIVVVFALTHGGFAVAWKEGALAGIAAAMSLLPEEFVVVLSIYLAIGAWRLSRNGVLARRMPAVEALGQTTVLCVDKTGTLTENRMSLAVVRAGGVDADLERALEPVSATLLDVAARASRKDAFDPMDRAVHALAERRLGAHGTYGESLELVREYPLTPELPAISRAWRRPGVDELLLASKGAPEAIARLCALSDDARARLLAEVETLARDGRRVLAVARGASSSASLPARHDELRLELLGLLGFEDPLRASVPAAIAECQRAGIRVVMITGDHPATARAIAVRAGIHGAEAILPGAEVGALDDAALQARLGSSGVIARVVPEQKLRIVRALIARGEVVAMTGDGVNDAPALRAAHVGVAMGGRGTDVAREAAGLVLLDDDFASLVGAVRMGRRIRDNIQHAMIFIIAVHVPIAAVTMGQALLPALPLLLLPVHLAFLELIIDPACSLVFEADPPDEHIMERPPRPRDEPLVSRRVLALAVLEGLSALGACGLILALTHRDTPPDETRAMAFTTLVISIIVMLVANRAHAKTRSGPLQRMHRQLWILLTATLSLLALALFVPFAQRIFRFAQLTPQQLLLAVGIGLASLTWIWLVRAWARTRVHTA